MSKTASHVDTAGATPEGGSPAAVVGVHRQASTRMTISYLISCFLTVWSVVLLFVALQMDSWFYTATVSTTFNFGLADTCTNGACLSTTFADVQLISCEKSGETYRSFMYAVTWTLYIGIALSLLSIPTLLLGAMKANFKLIHAAVAMTLFACLSTASSWIVFVSMMEAWLWCNENYCAYYRAALGNPTADCFTLYGTAFVMVVCGSLLLLMSFAWSLIAGFIRESRKSTLKTVLKNRAGTEEPSGFDAPPGFVFDRSCGLYYSSELQMYLDPISLHYFDTRTHLWWNGSEWYTLASN